MASGWPRGKDFGGKDATDARRDAERGPSRVVGRSVGEKGKGAKDYIRILFATFLMVRRTTDVQIEKVDQRSV